MPDYDISFQAVLLLVIGITAFLANEWGTRTSNSSTRIIRRDPQRTIIPGSWLEQIQNDLEPFSSGVLGFHLDQACNLTNDLTRVLIYDNNLYVHKKCAPIGAFETSTGTPHAVLIMLLKVLCQYRIPNLELVLNLGDGARVDAQQRKPLPPVFSWGKTARHADILYPYWSFLWSTWPEQMDETLLADGITEEAWNRKISIGFWRGSTTGGWYTPDNWRNMTRTVLVQKCRERPDLCDAQFVQCVQCDPFAAAEMDKEVGFVPKVPPEEVFKYKYAILVDGNVSPSSRAKYFFEGDSLILFQETENYEFFYAALRPYKQYLPLSHGLDDLHARINWANQHPIEALSIIRDMQRFARTYLNGKAVNAYFKELLESYALLQRYEPSISQDFELVWLGIDQHNYFLNYMGRNGCPNWINVSPL